MVQGFIKAVNKWVLLGNQATHLWMVQRVRKDILSSPRYFTPMDLV